MKTFNIYVTHFKMYKFMCYSQKPAIAEHLYREYRLTLMTIM